MTRMRFVALCLLVGCLALAFAQPVQARWFAKKTPPENDPVKQVQTFQPPPENAMLTYCEPYRKSAVDLSKKPLLLKPFYEPRLLWLMNAYHKCTNELMTQEHEYLKHVDIELPPSLPKMKPVVLPINQPEAKQEVPNGNL